MLKSAKRLITLSLVLILVLSSIIAFPTSAASSSYRDSFIDALLDNQSFWYEYYGASVGHQGRITFADLNFDGKLELIMQYGGGSMLNCDADAFYFDGTTIYKAGAGEGSFNDAAFQNTFDGYYDSVNNKYRLLGTSTFRNGVAENWTGNYELFFDGSDISSKYYCSRYAIDKNFSGNYSYTYYNGAKGYADTSGYSTISESKYNQIKDDKMKNLIDINMHLEYIECSGWKKMSLSKKRSELQRAFDGFSYDKYTNETIGDVDGDGDVSVLDATSIQMHVASIEFIDSKKATTADTDKDGNISIMDATQIQLYIAKIITEF